MQNWFPWEHYFYAVVNTGILLFAIGTFVVAIRIWRTVGRQGRADDSRRGRDDRLRDHDRG